MAESFFPALQHKAPSKATAPAGRLGLRLSTASDFRLLGDLEDVIDLDAQIPHRRLQRGVPEEALAADAVVPYVAAGSPHAALLEKSAVVIRQ